MRKMVIILMLFLTLFLYSCSADYLICDGSYSDIVIKGHVDWTDYGKNIHSARYAKVRIWNDESLYSRLLTDTFTDENGNYEIRIKNSKKYGTSGRGLYVDFYPETEHILIKSIRGDDYHVRTTILSENLKDNGIECNVTFGDDLVGRGFSIAQAFEYAAEYVYEMEGKYLPQVTINFPSKYPSETYYDPATNEIHISEVNYFDWDVLLHEYGHYVEDMFEFLSAAGGWHYVNEDLIDRFNRDIGARKAWNEGWATYFSLSCQKHLAMSELGILNSDNKNTFGDDCYDVEKLKDTRIDVKTMWRYGEGCETSVAGFLLCLADHDISPIDQFAYGYKAVWDLVITNKVICMADFCECLHKAFPSDSNEIEQLISYFNSGV